MKRKYEKIYIPIWIDYVRKPVPHVSAIAKTFTFQYGLIMYRATGEIYWPGTTFTFQYGLIMYKIGNFAFVPRSNFTFQYGLIMYTCVRAEVYCICISLHSNMD